MSVENAGTAAIEVKGDSRHGAYHQGLAFERVRFSGPAPVKIDGLKDSRFDALRFSRTGGANPWQVQGSQGLAYTDVEPAPHP
ncbi:hypothetical protein D9M73_244390 [compost metagenome]